MLAIHESDVIQTQVSFSALLEGWFSNGDVSPDTLYGIQLLNEPKGENVWKVARDVYYPGNCKNYQLPLKNNQQI
jgi:hypothetical protein